MAKKKRDEFEPPPQEFPSEYIIRPQVFGARNKFGEIDDNGTVQKNNGRYEHVPGEFASLRSSGYWFLMNAILRELRITSRDRFIIDAHIDGKTSRQINTMLKNHDYFKPYQKSRYVNDRIAAIIRKYFLTPKSELNSVF